MAFYVLRTPVYIWNRIARYTHFILFLIVILGIFWIKGSFFDHEPQIWVLSMTPKWKIQPNTQNTVDGKEDFIMDIISPSGVNKTDKTQASPEFAHESPFFTNVFFLHLLSLGVTARLYPHEGFANISQSKRVGIIAIKNKRTGIHLSATFSQL